ncbi:MAG: helix-turn-helix domain-containing protein [Dysgonamonadaceae bacterium]|nr:helix-turn-helix domain-containing protein [Dysgonamonadaceae bacterium]
MEVITIESKAFKELQAKINTIANYITAHQETISSEDDEIWVDSYEVCTFLKISARTLQRLRSNGDISYSKIRGRNYYQISEIKRLIESRIIKSNHEFMQDLIKNHKLHAKERRDIK